jgi:seryl-tRNA synthetase
MRELKAKDHCIKGLKCYSNSINNKIDDARKRSNSQNAKILLERKHVAHLIAENKTLKEKLDEMNARYCSACEELACLRMQMNCLISLGVK